MTPKEKAKELYQKYYEISPEWLFEGEAIDLSKQCALIALEITSEFSDDSFRSCYDYDNTEEYLKEVKKEIEKL